MPWCSPQFPFFQIVFIYSDLWHILKAFLLGTIENKITPASYYKIFHCTFFSNMETLDKQDYTKSPQLDYRLFKINTTFKTISCENKIIDWSYTFILAGNI